MTAFSFRPRAWLPSGRQVYSAPDGKLHLINTTHSYYASCVVEQYTMPAGQRTHASNNDNRSVRNNLRVALLAGDNYTCGRALSSERLQDLLRTCLPVTNAYLKCITRRDWLCSLACCYLVVLVIADACMQAASVGHRDPTHQQGA